MPLGAIVAVCGLLIGLACLMAWKAVALAADGAFQLVRIIDSEGVYGTDARILATGAHQATVIVAVRAGVTDTHVLTILFGVGQLVLPALVWSAAIMLSREDRLVCAAVSLVAGLSAGATWFVNVSEIILAVPLTVLVAVFLWRRQAWRWRDAVVACAAATILVASYETAVLTGSVLAAWAAWRAASPSGRAEQIGCSLVALLSALSVLVAVWGAHTGSNPTHSQSFLYFIVSLEPWPFYVGLAGIAAVIAALGPWLRGTSRRVGFVLGCALLAAAVFELDPDVVTAFQARGGAAVACLALELFLWWSWIERRRSVARAFDLGHTHRRRIERTLLALPVVFVVSVVVVNVQAVGDWSRSLDAFRAEVDSTQGVAYVTDVLPPDRQDVLFDWTSSSLSLVVRGSPNAGILVDRNPAIVAYAVDDARAQLDDHYRWGE
jgi:hypothetical protein